MATYEVIARNTYKPHEKYASRLQPAVSGDPKVVKRNIESIDEAEAIVDKWNSENKPGRLMRRAFYREQVEVLESA